MTHIELRDDLKSNFRSWESDHDNVGDAQLLCSIMRERHPNEPLARVKEIVYHWVGYESREEHNSLEDENFDPGTVKNDPLDAKDFYDLMQVYRFCDLADQEEVSKRYLAVKTYVREHVKTWKK